MVPARGDVCAASRNRRFGAEMNFGPWDPVLPPVHKEKKENIRAQLGSEGDELHAQRGVW